MYKVLEAVVGSKAYGLDHPNSDTDYLGVFLEPTKNVVSLHRPKDSVTHTDPDWTYHELGKFIALLIKGNPSVTELLFMDEYTVRSLTGNLLIERRDIFLSRHAIATAYIGYAKAQIKRYQDHTGRYNNEQAARKNARHTFRLLIQACELLSTGTMSVKLSPGALDACWDASEYCISSPEAFKKMSDLWIWRTQQAEEHSPLPEVINVDYINDILKQIRYDYYWSVPNDNR